jgi:3-methyladenine DNA glycosylase/8-oxoguanine DNA glycosylase
MDTPMPLAFSHVVELAAIPPFNFDATMHKPSHFPSSDNEWRPGTRWQTMLWQDVPLGLKFEEIGTTDHPRIRLTVWANQELGGKYLGDLAEEVSYRYNLRLDLAEFNQRFSEDPRLGPLLRKWRGMRPLNYSSLYEYLMIAVVLQNATVKRSVSMLQTLFENYGFRLAYDEKVLSCFWNPDRMDGVPESDLRQLKLGYRAKSIKRVSTAFSRHEIDEFALRGKPRAEQRIALLSLYGVGPASVGYILFDVFHHMGELEYISPWEQKIYSRIFFDTTTDDPIDVKSMLDLFERRFGVYKMLAVSYLWDDVFWRRNNESIEWLDRLIRL